MRKLARVFLAFLLALFASTPLHAATVPGTIPGNFGVSESGAATYSIPIAVPPGTAGMEPRLSLNHSSQGGNGIAGVGWSIGGLSSITRCPQTIVQDGQTRGVQIDANDRFCLDGQRLIVVKNGPYGAVGAEYRTEIESFSKIVSSGGTVGDPQYFTVWTKAGQIIEFGNTADSRFEAQGKTIAAVWAVNKISDTVGNYLTFSYFEDNASGEHRITSIDYTGNAAAGVSPYNSVEFQYENRPDADVAYVRGSKFQKSQRLSHIVTSANGAPVMDYGLAYETGATTGKSRLLSVTQCAANGDCMSPTTFAWQEGEAGLETTGTDTGIANTNALYAHAMDINGDGMTDIVYPAGTTWKVRLREGSGFSAEIDTLIANTGYQYARPADFNADGRVDLLVPYANGRWHVLRATGDATIPFETPVDTGLTDSGKTNNPQFQDINGDGLPDVIHGHDAYWYTALGNGGGFEPESKIQPPADGSIGGEYVTDWARPVDFQGDGLADVVIPRNYGNKCSAAGCYQDFGWDVLSSTGTGGLSGIPTNMAAYIYSGIVGTGVVTIQRNQQAIDVNRDGNTDLLSMGYSRANGDSWFLCLNWGGDLRFEHCTDTTFDPAPLAGQVMIQTDWNGDGKPDMLDATFGAQANWAVYQSNSDGQGMTQLDSGIPQKGYDANPLVGDFNGDGLLDLMLAHDGKWYLHLHRGLQPDQLTAITDGVGATRAISYKPLTDSTVYTKGSGAVFPQVDIQDATYVVSETAADDGIGGQFRLAYRYEGARAHLQGRGFLGFAALEQTDVQTGIVTRTEYRQDFPYAGLPLSVTQTTAGSIQLKRVDNTYQVKAIPAGGQFPYLAYSNEQGKDLNGAALPGLETWNTYGDNWGNLTQVITQTSDGFRKQTDNTYGNNATDWFLGRLQRTAVASTANGVTQTRVSSFGYSGTTGLLIRETIEPDQPQYKLSTVYAPDAFGNRQTVTVSSPATGTAAIVTRSSTTTYDGKGQFPATLTNALGHSETKAFDPRFGAVASLTGPNNLTTAWQYDGFGRKTRENRADGTYTVWTYATCDATCPANGVYYVYTQVFASNNTQAAPDSAVYYDKLNREIGSATQGFTGLWIFKDTVYDGQGRVAQVSRPYFDGKPVYWTRSEYDDLGRLVRAYEPDSATPVLSVDYNGLTVTRTDRKGQATVETRDSQGQKLSVTDALGNTTAYAYDPFGNLAGTTDPAGNQIVNLYDIRGRKIQTTDPDLGLWTYDYDALGQLVKQTDAKSQVTTLSYDKLGRMTSRAEPGMTSTWVWDTSPVCGKGKLYQATTDLGYSRTHTYDALCRPSQTTSNLGTGNPTLTSSVTYDGASRTASITYPNGLAIRQTYTGRGYLLKITNDATAAEYWRANAIDAEGRVTKETTGNGIVTVRGYQASTGRLLSIAATDALGQPVQDQTYAYDTLGNVKTFTDAIDQLVIAGVYDPLNRLIKTNTTLAGVLTSQVVGYDALGNITNKTAVGNYRYGADPLCPAGTIAGPHAACKAGANTYAYDANGNLTGGGGRSIGWTAWNMPSSITSGGASQSWLYNPEHDRYRYADDGRTTWYLNPGVHQGGHYERTQYSSGTIEHRVTLYGGGRPVGEIVSFDGGAPGQTRYFHSDAQGSINAVTDETGAVITRYRYDAWGKQTVTLGSNAGIDQTRQGHTGHEMLDGGLTHMNGRLYDPTLARFVSADPIIQAPYNLQSLNRYSYVLNNPLYYTDPSGFSWWTDFRDGFIKPAAGIAAAVMLGPGGAWALTGNAFANSLIAGAVSGGITGGRQGALQGAVTAGLFYGVGNMGFAPGSFENTLAHGVAGGVSSAMFGGSFKAGFLSAGFAEAAGPYLPEGRIEGTIAHAIVGGTASVLGGGKFANGAQTGAFGYLFNKCVHGGCGSFKYELGLSSYPYGRDDAHYLTQDALLKLEAVDRLWNQLYPGGPSIGVGNGSLSNEALYSPHTRSHIDGTDIDLRPFRLDGASAPVNYRNSSYDPLTTQDLVNTIKVIAPNSTIIFNDPRISGVRSDGGRTHDDHLHWSTNR